MSTISDELLELSRRLEALVAKFNLPKCSAPLEKLEKEAERFGKSWSGSWLGHHSCVYYKDFVPPPPGAHFSQEWGLWRISFGGSIGDWQEYSYDEVYKTIYRYAGNPNLKAIDSISEEAKGLLEDSRAEVVSLLTTTLEERNDSFISKLKHECESIKFFRASDFINHFRPTGQFMSRDTVAIGQGLRNPPHLGVIAEVMEIRSPVTACENLAKIAKRGASHLAKRERHVRRKQEEGSNVFIGHGRSLLWKDLKDFIQDRLELSWDEFNRIPVAGVTNIARLSQMLDDAAIAFLIMTAEDEQANGKMNARMNVVHEAGLFQGRLGFTRAIVLLEEGCEEFSNIQGLGQIRFPKGNIKAVFEDVRQVLEREGLI